MAKKDRCHFIIRREGLPQSVFTSSVAIGICSGCRLEVCGEEELNLKKTELCHRRWSRKAQEKSEESFLYFCAAKKKEENLKKFSPKWQGAEEPFSAMPRAALDFNI